MRIKRITMSTNNVTVLGIDPGARQIGISVFKDRQLIFYGVKTLGGKDPNLKIATMKQILKGFITAHQIKHVAVKRIVFVQQHRSFVKVVFDELRSFLKKQPLGYSEYNPAEIRNLICEYEESTRANAARVLAQKFPELTRFMNVSKVWQKKYYSLLLEAVAVGFICAGKDLN